MMKHSTARLKLHAIKKKLTTPEYIKILVLRTVGNFLLLSSIFMIGKTFYQPVREELRYFVERKVDKQYVLSTQPIPTASPTKGKLAKLLNISQVEVLQPVDPDFSIVIPKIGANAPVLPNINAADDQIYLEALKKGVAHALGSRFPGEGGHVFLFAHSTDYIWNVGTYNAVFYLLYKLEPGDEVNLFYQGQRYVYSVLEKRVVDPSQVELLTRQTNKEFLTLQTCWPPGTTLQRLMIFATRKAE